MTLLVNGDALRLPLADNSAHCVVTSPPYWGLRDYGIADQLGLEPTPEEFIANMVQVFREVRRVLREDGQLWLNLGDSYMSQPSWGRGDQTSTLEGRKHSEVPHALKDQLGRHHRGKQPGLKPKDLCGIPWRVALALQADGWWLRSDIIWCLSGGTWLYARTQKGDMPMMLKDAARLDPTTVKLWDGKRWAQVKGWSKSERQGTELEIVLRSGERISCTPSHRFPTQHGIVPARELTIGDCLQRADLPEPEYPRDCAIDEHAAWFAGLYIAEGSMANDCIQISGHAKEEYRWSRVCAIAERFGGSTTRTVDGNTMNIRVYGKVLRAILAELVTGHTAKDKGFAPVVWRYSNLFIRAMLEGYLSGDGHWDSTNQRWRLGLTRNYNLERDLRTACARLGWHIILKLSHAKHNGKDTLTFRGEIRRFRTGHGNQKQSTEIVEIRKSRCRYVYDVGIEGEPHLFALSSGILTHNSKPNPMPESVTDRPTKSHEYLFLLTKSAKYFYDAEAVREAHKEPWRGHGEKERANYNSGGIIGRGRVGEYEDGIRQYNPAGRNRRTVWTIATHPYSGAHFATFPPALVEPCIKAGTSERGVCPVCGAPWERVIERTGHINQREPAHVPGNSDTKTDSTGWAPVTMATNHFRPTCDHYNDQYRTDYPQARSARKRHQRNITGDWWHRTRKRPGLSIWKTIPARVLDPFAGSGTTVMVARSLGRFGIGLDLSWAYLYEQARPRLELDRLDEWETGRKAEANLTDLPLFAEAAP